MAGRDFAPLQEAASKLGFGLSGATDDEARSQYSGGGGTSTRATPEVGRSPAAAAAGGGRGGRRPLDSSSSAHTSSEVQVGRSSAHADGHTSTDRTLQVSV